MRLGEGWINSVEPGQIEVIQKILGDDWKEEAGKYIAKLEEEEEEKTALGEPRKEEGGEEETEEKATLAEARKEEGVEEAT